MSIVKWGSAVSGDWNTASNWSPAVVPSGSSTVQISAAAPAGSSYTITITTPVGIAALTLFSKSAEVLAESTLKAKKITIQAGYLDIGPSSPGSVTSLSGDATVSGGTLGFQSGASFHGTLMQTGGTLVADNSLIFGTVISQGGIFTTSLNTSQPGEVTLENATWEGALQLAGYGTLAVNGGATFTGTNGSGAGTVSADVMRLINVSNLNNATITLSSTVSADDLVIDTPGVTFGSALTLLNPGIDAGSAVTTITNDGTLIGSSYGNTGIYGDSEQEATNATFVNNGYIQDNFDDYAGTSVNNGVINVYSSDRYATFASAGTLTNAGSILVTSSGAFEAGTMINTNLIAVTGGNLEIQGGLDNTGLITLSTGSELVPTSTIENTGTIALTGGSMTLDPYPNESPNIAGNGVIDLGTSSTAEGATITVNLPGAVSAGQTLAFIAGQDTLGFGSYEDAQLFAGTITGLDGSGVTDPSLIFDSATISTATITGSAIDIAFSNGAHAALATGTPLGGSLSWAESGNNAILSYARAGSAIHI